MNVKIVADPAKYDVAELRRIAAEGLPADAVAIYRGRNTVAVSPDRRVNYKAFGVPGFFKGIVYGYFRKPKALRAYDNACRLLSLAIRTPEPLGAVVCRNSAGLLRESYYLCRHLEGWSDLRGAEKRADFRPLARALARFMHTLHSKGVLMKDFTQGNILFREDGGNYHFALIDINRMDFGVTDRKRLFANFGATLDTFAGMEVLAAEYAALADDADKAALAESIMDVYRAHIARLVRKNNIKDKLRRLRGKQP